VEPEVKFLDAVVEKLGTGAETVAKSGAAGATGAAVVGATAGGTLLATLSGAAAGLAIGILVHAGKSYRKMQKEERDSPYRYLTLMENSGVVFRSDLRSSPPKKNTALGA
jgi:hypothetical protein